jgi:TDG/mug DNA glycosylase family protein
MDAATIAIYEQRANEWESSRRAGVTQHARAFASAVACEEVGFVTADLGCGPGWHSADLGPTPVVAVDAARAMLELVPRYAPAAWRVQADLGALPFRRGAVGAAWGSKSYVHLARVDFPLALAELHRSLAVDAVAELALFGGDMELGTFDHDEFAGRHFSLWDEMHLRDVVVGAGFEVESWDVTSGKDGTRTVRVRMRRLVTLPDYVGPAMRILVVGLNPSIYAAEAGVGFARPGNRFWPAALAAGLVTRDRDPRHALLAHRVGMTDLVKRATVRADQITGAEYRTGFSRIERLVGWLRPSVVCVLGLTGWRLVTDRSAVAGIQPAGLAGAPVYVMPNPSGLNARVPLSELADHLRRAVESADSPPRA